MAPRVKTRDRIVAESLELFNAQGERNVTTNSLLKFAAMITSTASGSSGRARLLPV